MKLRRYVLGGYVIWWAVLVALYYGQPGLRAETWGLIGLSGVSGIVAGVAINRPSRKLPWLLLAAALASFTAGQVSFLVAQRIGIQLPFPSFADVLYLLTYPLYTTGLLIFIWSRTPDRDWRSLIDALTVTAGLALLSWIYLILPYVHSPAAVLAAEERRHRLPARRRARAGHAGPAARAGGGADQDRGVPDPGRPRGAGVGRRRTA